jgi:hypothetical protein
MKKTLQDQYLLIKEGKGHKGVFLTEAKRQFPNIVRNAATFEEAAASLKTKNIIAENVIGLGAINSIFEPKKKESYELAYEAFLAEAKKKENEEEKVKAEEKKVSKPVEEDASHNFDRRDDKNLDNLIFDQVMTGYYAEMKDPKNCDKTMQELKDIVMKNLQKDPIHYTKDGQFGVKGLGYTTEAPGLGEPKEAKGPYKSSGYGNLNEGMFDRFKSKPLGDVEGAKKDIMKSMRAFLQRYSGLQDASGLSDEQVLDKIKGAANLSTRSTASQANKLAGELYKIAKPLFEEESLEESKLRGVIRKMINEELDEMIKINPVSGGGGKRFIPSDIILSNDVIKKFDLSNPGPNTPAYDDSIRIPHVKIATSKEGVPSLFVSDFLDIALKGITRGRTTRETEVAKNTLQKMQGDITDKDWSMIRALIKKYAEVKPISYPIGGGKTALYHQVKFPSDTSVGDNFETGFSLDKVDNGLKITLPKKKEENKELEEMTNRESLLKEGVEKELAAINKEAEYEILEVKLQKISSAIEERQSRLSKLDEDEAMSDLMDKKKLKELGKDIKTLEKAKAKLEKIVSKFKGKKAESKEVIDEIEDESSEELPKEYVKNAYGEEYLGKTIDSILTDYPNLSPNGKINLRRKLEARKEKKDAQ